MGRLRSVDGMLAPAVAEMLTQLDLAAEDVAAARLARQYAAAIDAAGEPGEALDKLGPKLLACLEALGATPRSRAAIKKGGAGAGQGKLAALRAAR